MDRDTDKPNPRKDSFFFGARGTEAQLAALPQATAWVNAPFFVLLTALGGWKMVLILIGIVGVLALYNQPQQGWRGRPPFELLNQLGYLLVLPMSMLLNHTPLIPWQAVLYLVLFCTHAHLMGEVKDVIPDRATGRRTLATTLGVRPVKRLILGLVLAEAFLIFTLFRDYVLGTFLLAGAVWLIVDMIVYRTKNYTQKEFLLLGVALNVAGFASMAWIWYTGTLTQLP